MKSRNFFAADPQIPLLRSTEKFKLPDNFEVKILMNVTRAWTAMVSIGTALMLAEFNSFQAGEIRIGSPSAYADREGEGALGEDCCAPYHAQIVFPATDFAALGNKPHWLIYLTLRPDQSVTSPRTVHWPERSATNYPPRKHLPPARGS